MPAFTFKDPETGRSCDIPAGTKSVMHQRMGFYVTRDGRPLTFGFYSFSPSPQFGPNTGQGLGRVVREIHTDGTYGPVYFIRYNRHAGWNESNTRYPFYRESPDRGFVKVCQEVLDNKPITLQWWEEDRAADGLYTFRPNDLEPKAFSF